MLTALRAASLSKGGSSVAGARSNLIAGIVVVLVAAAGCGSGQTTAPATDLPAASPPERTEAPLATPPKASAPHRLFSCGEFGAAGRPGRDRHIRRQPDSGRLRRFGPRLPRQTAGTGEPPSAGQQCRQRGPLGLDLRRPRQHGQRSPHRDRARDRCEAGHRARLDRLERPVGPLRLRSRTHDIPGRAGGSRRLRDQPGHDPLETEGQGRGHLHSPA